MSGDDDETLRWPTVSAEIRDDFRVFQTVAKVARHPRTGADRRFTVLRATDWCNVIALTPDDRVVLVRQWRHGTERVHLEIPGGMVDPGERHGEAAARELREETGYVSEHWIELGVCEPNPAILTNRLWTWLALDVRRDGEVELDEGEVIEVELAGLDEVGAMLRDGRIGHALVIAAFGHLMLRTGGLRRP